ncbi:MAG TPA: hypothetical protein VMM92_09060 [Thermoanaerobaculia bacterium]|nr:hypothetical protein [Thermoanaerobaculia bacterium]
MLRKILLGCLLAWAGFAFLAELSRAVSGFDLRERYSPATIGWRFGIPQVVRLSRFLEAARPLLSRGERVAFASPPAPQADLFFRYRWAAYLLPEVDLVPWEDQAGRQASELLSYSYRQPGPGLHLKRRLPGGFLYQVGP